MRLVHGAGCRRLVALLLAFMPWPVLAETFIVTTEADDNGSCEVDDCALREALLAANARLGPDTVLVPAGTYRIELSEPPDFQVTGTFVITDDLELIGEPGTTVAGDGLHRVFFILECTVTLSHLTITGGVGDGNGGGIRASLADVTIVDSTIQGNETNLHGGGIGMILGALHLVNSTVVGNSASVFGGGVYRFGITNVPGEVRILNSTISGNDAREGGGVAVNGFGPLTISSSTITDNTASFRSDAVSTDRTQPATYSNTVFVGQCGQNLRPVSLGGNVESPGATCFLDHTTDRMDVPEVGLLDPLGFHGGLTPTHALPAGSPAIDTGVDGECPLQDQRGRLRPADGDGDGEARCDVGAFELQPVSAAVEIPALGRGARWLLAVVLAAAGVVVLWRRSAL